MRARARTGESLVPSRPQSVGAEHAHIDTRSRTCSQPRAEIDADGGGALDNKELVQAWQKATGEELTPEQAQEMIDEVDEDKNGTLDA